MEMDNPPVPKPRNNSVAQNEPAKKPVPLPRTKLSNTNKDKVTAHDILRSISSVSKQFTDDVAQKVQSSAKTTNEMFEKSFQDGSRFANRTLEKTLNTSRAVRDSVTKSVIEGTKSAGLKLRRRKINESMDNSEVERCASMPDVDVTLFDNIQFHSPLTEHSRVLANQYKIRGSDLPSLNLNSTQYNDLSLHSVNSDSNTDTVSNFSYDSRDSEHNTSFGCDSENSTYDTPKLSSSNSFVSRDTVPDVPERRKKRDGITEFKHQNSLENWNPFDEHLLPTTETVSRPSKSTIFEFDPLNTCTPNTSNTQYDGMSNELLLLVSFLSGDTYGSIEATDSSEENFESYHDSEYFNPPTPPERSDSLFPDTTTSSAKDDESSSSKAGTTSWFYDKNENENILSTADKHKSVNSTVMQRFSHMLKLDVLNKNSSKNSQNTLKIVEKPPINKMIVSFYCGNLSIQVSGGVEDLFKNSQARYCMLSDQKMMCYTDPTNLVLKEVYCLDSIYSVQIVLPLSSSTNQSSYCMELSINPGGTKPTSKKILLSCNSVSERRNWAQKFAENMTNGFPAKYTTEFTRFGWCFLKEEVTGEWQGAWVMLIRRVLVYNTTNEQEVKVVDLRKTRCVVTQEADEDTKKRCATDGSSNLLLDCPHTTLYLRFPNEKELKGWRYMIKLSAHNNGAYIHHQQLTKDDVPTIVDKCISFIYAHGSTVEGIYRKAGSTTVLSDLLAKFRKDAWSVQLSPGAHSEHDVAGVLKRFFRDLPEPLLPQQVHTELIAALTIKEDDTRHAEFHRIMSAMPLVPRNTARKLFAHLHFLNTLSHINKMSAENLASVWAPTVMPTAVTSDTLQSSWSLKEVFVIRELIAKYELIWRPTEAEKRREAAVKRVLLQVLHNTVSANPKAAGDLKTWIYITDRSVCHQVSLNPKKTAGDICNELCEKANTESHLLMLEEVICGESMRRIIHVDEIVLDVVLRWSYWDESDRKDNYLVVTENRLLHEIEALKASTSLVCGELKFANEATKAFKTHMFEFQNKKLCYFKDKQGSHKIEDWDIKNILWYIGYEPKRNPQSRWAITFIPRKHKEKRSKERPWFGCTIAGAVTEDQLKWMTAMMFAEHANILPNARLVIT